MFQFLTSSRNVVGVSVLITVIAAYFSTGSFHADEHYQILEFAGLKLGTTTAEQMPWEYAHQIRPAFQPFIAVGISNIISKASTFDPFLLTFLLRLLAGSLALLSSWMMYSYFVQKIDDKVLKRTFLWLTFLFWAIVFTRVRFSSENLSTALFIIGFVLCLKETKKHLLNYFFVGLILGLSTIIRFQMGIMVIGLGLWLLFIHKISLKHLGSIVIGGLIAMVIGTLIDRWFYGDWVFTSWNYFDSNILKDRASSFGRNPWWKYLSDSFVTLIPPFSLLLIGAVFIFPFLHRKDPISWSIVPFLAIHFFIAHKELRFLIPVIGFVPIMIIRLLEWIDNRWPKMKAKPYVHFFIQLFWISNFILLSVVVFKTNDHRIALYQSISNHNLPLFGYKDNPYAGDPDIQFFKSKLTSFVGIDSAEELTYIDHNKFLVVTKQDSLPPQMQGNIQLIYQTFPEWTRVFNFNNWMERTSSWKLYEVTQSTQ